MSTFRQLPSAIEAEKSLLGNMMMYPDAMVLVSQSGLQQNDFFDPRNQMVYQACIDIANSHEQVDGTTVMAQIVSNHEEDTVTEDYIRELLLASVTSMNTESYIHLIQNKSLIRKMIETSQRIVEAGYENPSNLDDYLDTAEKDVLTISRDRNTSEFKPLPMIMRENYDHIQKMAQEHTDITGMKTGYRELDHTLHGLQRGDMIVLAARPAMGKTAVALNIASRVADYQRKGAVAIFSLEMPAEQLGLRLLSARSRISQDKLRTGRGLTMEESNRLRETVNQSEELPIYFDDTAGIRISDIYAKCRRLKAEKNLNLVMIDYIQLITNGNQRRGENRQQEVSDISRALKGLARELDVPVLVLSQLSRSVEAREDKHPQLSDLRESGAIEQDADIVMMLYRTAYYDDKAKEEAEKSGNERLEINIAKHRNGATKKIELAFQAATSNVCDIDYTHQEEGK